jgi:hypothetical protein
MRFLNRLNHELLKKDVPLPLTESQHHQQQVNSTLLEIVRNIPRDPQLFYQDFGLLTHPRTGKLVPELAPYQVDLWKRGHVFKYRLVCFGSFGTVVVLEFLAQRREP